MQDIFGNNDRAVVTFLHCTRCMIARGAPLLSWAACGRGKYDDNDALTPRSRDKRGTKEGMRDILARTSSYTTADMTSPINTSFEDHITNAVADDTRPIVICVLSDMALLVHRLDQKMFETSKIANSTDEEITFMFAAMVVTVSVLQSCYCSTRADAATDGGVFCAEATQDGRYAQQGFEYSKEENAAISGHRGELQLIKQWCRLRAVIACCRV